MKWLDILEDVLWPRGVKCLCCDSLSEGELLCPDCRKGLAVMRLAAQDVGDERVRSVFRHDGIAKDLVLRLKLECLADAATVLAQYMTEEIRHMELPSNTLLTWVAMPERRRQERGIDHGRILCEAVGALSGLQVKGVLKRTCKVHTQRGLGREERLRNLNGSFSCVEHLSCPVLLIDDVKTTGATISTCAEALVSAGATEVYALTATKATLAPRK